MTPEPLVKSDHTKPQQPSECCGADSAATAASSPNQGKQPTATVAPTSSKERPAAQKCCCGTGGKSQN